MRTKTFIILAAAACLAVTVMFFLRPKDYVEVPYELTTDFSKNIKVLVNTNSLSEGFFRLKFVPKRDKVNIVKMEMRYENKTLLTFTELEGKLDFTNREPKTIQVNDPFPAGKIDFKKLTIYSIEGNLPNS